MRRCEERETEKTQKKTQHKKKEKEKGKESGYALLTWNHDQFALESITHSCRERPLGRSIYLRIYGCG
jgi:hypothetical protein